MNRMRKFNILISTVAKLLAFITLMVYIIRIFPAVLYCMSYKYAEPFITVFNKFDFEAHYEFSSAENLCNNRILYAFISAETFAESTTISAWKIFCSIRSSKLSLTAPTNIP